MRVKSFKRISRFYIGLKKLQKKPEWSRTVTKLVAEIFWDALGPKICIVVCGGKRATSEGSEERSKINESEDARSVSVRNSCKKILVNA